MIVFSCNTHALREAPSGPAVSKLKIYPAMYRSGQRLCLHVKKIVYISQNVPEHSIEHLGTFYGTFKNILECRVIV